jgi:hypothetical protein
MKINGSLGNNINFIEQKKSNTFSSNTQKNDTLDNSDKFIGKAVSANAILKSNESLSILEIALNAISKLSSDTDALKKLSDKLVYFQSQERELTKEFESITEGMLDVVDNTMFKDTQIFYSTLNFKVESYEADLSLNRDVNIEDLYINDKEELNNFANNLESIKKDINQIKNYIQVASFNSIAALHVDSPLLNIHITQKLTLNVDDIKGVHDVNSLKDKVSLLLAD